MFITSYQPATWHTFLLRTQCLCIETPQVLVAKNNLHTKSEEGTAGAISMLLTDKQIQHVQEVLKKVGDFRLTQGR